MATYYQAIYDDGANRWCYYSDTVIDSTPLSGDTSPNWVGPTISQHTVLWVSDGGAGGNVVGPAGSTNLAITRFDGPTGLLLKNSLAILSDVGAILTPAGTAALPAFSPLAAAGLYATGVANTLGISTNGVLRFSVNTTALTSTLKIVVPNGTVGAPSLTFDDGFQLHGFYTPSAGVIGFVSGGQERWRLNSGMFSGTAGDSRINSGLGDAAAPSYAFVGGTGYSDKGFYSATIDEIDAGVAGTLRWSFGAAGADLDVFWGRRINSRVGQYNPNAGMAISGLITTGNTPAVTLDNNGISFTGAGGATQIGVGLQHTVNQTLSAAFTALDINTLQTAPGTGNQFAIDFRIGGSSQGHITSNGKFRSAGGSAALPGVSVNAAGTLGIYDASGKLGISVGGVSIVSIAGSSFLSSAPFQSQFAASAADPSFNPGLVGGGMYSPAAHTLGFTTNSTLRFSISTTALVSTLQFSGTSAGGSSAPPYSFTGDLDTGMYWVGADRLGFGVGGASLMEISTTQILGANGGVGAPAWSFILDDDSGMYRIAANEIGFATNGVLRLSMNTTTLTAGLPLAMGANKITGLAVGTTTTDAVNQGQLQQPVNNPQSGAYAIAASDFGNVITATGAGAQAFSLADHSANLIAGRILMITIDQKALACQVTITPGGTVSINRAAAGTPYVATAGAILVMMSDDGLNWRV